MDSDHVLVEFPDTDQMKYSSMIYICPNYSEYSNVSTHSDNGQFLCSVYVICKRDSNRNLVEKVYTYYTALYNLLREETTLGGVVDFVDVSSADFYPQIEGTKGVAGIETSITCNFENDFCVV